jgi:acetyl-CoA decarbonylase/synthase complex subunit gamma
MDAWILVLDTRGINVWCAAGKGTFGTDEIVARVASVGLSGVVSHRKLILPQLGAPGVSAHEVKRRSGFRVIFGPVRADDIPDFIEAGMKATPEMRRVTFPFRDRVVLIPVELTMSLKYLFLAVICLILLSGFGPDLYSLERVTTVGSVSAAILILTYIAGASLPPALLPWLPGRPFSIKGAWVGFGMAALFGLYAAGNTGFFDNWATSLAWFCIIPAVISFQAMNFTGSSTYTSLSGVTKEMRVALPIQISVAVVGVGLWIAGLFL